MAEQKIKTPDVKTPDEIRTAKLSRKERKLYSMAKKAIAVCTNNPNRITVDEDGKYLCTIYEEVVYEDGHREVAVNYPQFKEIFENEGLPIDLLHNWCKKFKWEFMYEKCEVGTFLWLQEVVELEIDVDLDDEEF